MGDGFRVEPEGLEGFARTSLARQQAFGEVQATLAEAQIGRDSFGHIPMVGSRIYTAYDEHVEACTAGVASAAEGMASIGAGVRGLVLEYTRTDEAAADDMRTVEGEIVPVRIRGGS
jgi:hypothetical protein